MLDKVMNVLAVILMVAEGSALGFLIWAWRRDTRTKTLQEVPEE